MFIIIPKCTKYNSLTFNYTNEFDFNLYPIIKGYK